MGVFAIIENGVVVNTILAESAELAESLTGKTCVESTLENPAVIGLGYVNGVFEQPVTEEHEVFPPLQPGDEGYIAEN